MLILQGFLSLLLLVIVGILAWGAYYVGFSLKFNIFLYLFALTALVGIWWNWTQAHSPLILTGIIFAGVCIIWAAQANFWKYSPSNQEYVPDAPGRF